jgi:hypothetical protein
MSSWRYGEEMFDSDSEGGEEQQRNREKKKKKSKQAQDSPKYMTMREISGLQVRGLVAPGTQTTLATLLGEQNVKARNNDGIVELVNTAFGETFMRMNIRSGTATIYDGSCVNNRNPLSYMGILLDGGYSATIRRGEARDEDPKSEDKSTIAVGTPASANGPASIDLYANILQPTLAYSEDRGETRKWIDQLRERGYVVKVWACGEEALAEVRPNAPEVDIKYTKGTFDALAKQCVQALREIGLSTRDATC